ncbi:MAG: hypothetical protein R3C11_24295 [Planctomycetaceae bacterium]
MRWDLTSQYGLVIDNFNLFTSSDASSVSDTEVVRNLEAGTYRIKVYGFGTATGTYAFTLKDLDSGTTVSTATNITGQLDPANKVRIFTSSVVLLVIGFILMLRRLVPPMRVNGD